MKKGTGADEGVRANEWWSGSWHDTIRRSGMVAI